MGFWVHGTFFLLKTLGRGKLPPPPAREAGGGCINLHHLISFPHAYGGASLMCKAWHSHSRWSIVCLPSPHIAYSRSILSLILPTAHAPSHNALRTPPLCHLRPPSQKFTHLAVVSI